MGVRRWILILVMSSLPWSKSMAAVVSTSVAVVGSRVITSREIVISGILEHWFLVGEAYEKGKPKGQHSKQNRKDWVVGEKSDAFRAELSTVILEYMVQAEAESFSVAQISNEEIQKVVTQIQSDLSDWTEWKKLEVTSDELTMQISRHLRAKNFLKFKADALGFQVTDEEAHQYYEKNKQRFGNSPFAQFKDSIKEHISQKDVESKLKDWIQVLRKKYQVRMVNVGNEK